MKKTLLTVCIALTSSLFAQDCSKLFISEYVEGWSNNKALEIYNPTSSAIDLSEYVVARYSNGSNSATVANSVQLSGIVGPHDVFVAVLDKRDSLGTGQEAPVWDSLQARADGFFAPVYNTSSSFYWNGDDCIVLLKGTLTSNPTQVVATIPGMTVIDIFGKIGEQPTNASGGTSSPTGGWSTASPYNGGTNGVIVTVDHSLIRKSSVKKGVVNPAISVFNPLAEYDSIPAVIVRLDANGDTIFGTVSGNPILDGNWASLGYHACDCNPLSVSEKTQDVLAIYPNPSNGTFNVKGLKGIETISVFNTLGQKVESIHLDGKTTSSFELSQKGVYFVHFVYANGEKTTKKVIVK
ncbi:MAG: lamin tail domain-containing protein [Crocinitomicaceae bacterium]